MHHAARMGVVEPLGDLRQDVDQPVVAERLGTLQQLLEIRPLDELHGNETDPLAALVDDVVDGDDVWMGEDPRTLCFAHESAAELRVLLILGGESDAEGLQRDLTADERVARQVDDSHGALADLLEDLVAA